MQDVGEIKAQVICLQVCPRGLYNECMVSALYLCKLPGVLHSNTDPFTYTRREIAEVFMYINLGLKNRA